MTTTKTKGVCVRCGAPTVSPAAHLCNPCLVSALDAIEGDEPEVTYEAEPGEISYLDDGTELCHGCGNYHKPDVPCVVLGSLRPIWRVLRDDRPGAPISRRSGLWLVLAVVACAALWGVAIWGIS